MDDPYEGLEPLVSSTSPTPNPLANALVFLLTPHPVVLLSGLAIVLLVPVLLHWFVTRSSPYGSLPSVLLAGPSGAGKTALLALLERRAPGLDAKAQTEGGDGSSINGTHDPDGGILTHTSQTPGTVELAVSEDGRSRYTDDLDAAGARAKKFLLVDTPGHGKLRQFASSRLASLANPSGSGSGASSRLRAIVFVVDAAALGDSSAADGNQDALPAAAGYLYDVLLSLQKRTGSGKSSRAPTTIPLLIAANKADLFTALPAPLVRGALEAELGRIRHTRSRALLDSGVGVDGSSGEADDWLGEYGSDKFSFAQMREFDIDVDVLGGSVLTGDVDKWWAWTADKL